MGNGAADLTLAFWVSLASGWLANTSLAQVVQPREILALNGLLLLLLTSCLVLSLTFTSHSLVLWICSSIITFTLAPMVASTLARANQCIGVWDGVLVEL